MHAYLFGWIHRTPDIPLNQICPNGWSEFDVHSDPLQTSIAILSLGAYTPFMSTVTCADTPLVLWSPRVQRASAVRDGHHGPLAVRPNAQPAPHRPQNQHRTNQEPAWSERSAM